jgi:HEAT repeat protein
MLGSMCVLMICMGGCGKSSDQRQAMFSTEDDQQNDVKHRQVLNEIALMANAKADIDNAEALKVNQDAQNKLIARGSSIENDLVQALQDDHDWGVRLGCVQVLDAVGTSRCVPYLITALTDPEPVVALYADKLLVALCRHDEIPSLDAGTGANGIPPLPPKHSGNAPIDSDMKDWSNWYLANHGKLHTAWAAWWQSHKDKIKID